MSDLAKRPLGKSNVRVTSLGLGTVPISGFNADVSYDEFEQTILSGYAAGIRYFDCAPCTASEVRAFPGPCPESE